MKIDWKTGALAVCAVAIWGVFFALTYDGRPAEAKKLVARSLRDPGSAQFRDVKRVGESVCGEVNGKNAYGAYAGFKHFIVDAGNVTLEPDIPSERLQLGISQAATDEWSAYMDFSGVWRMRCQSTLPDLPAAIQPDTSRLDKWIKEH